MERLFNTAASHSSINIKTLPSLPRIAAGRRLISILEDGERISRHNLRSVMVDAYGGTDAQGIWTWAMAYDAAEVAEILYCLEKRDLWSGEITRIMLERLDLLSGLQPPVRMRTECTNSFQQFSTPLPMARLAVEAAMIGSSDIVLEPSAGHGHIALFTGKRGDQLLLNELDLERRRVLNDLFATPATGHDASQINDRLDPTLRPSVVVMNPPFARNARTGLKTAEAEAHVASAFARLAAGGRLVSIVGSHFDIECPTLSPLLTDAILVADLRLSRGAFSCRGTGVETRLIVLDKGTESNRSALRAEVDTTTDLAALVNSLPDRLDVTATGCLLGRTRSIPARRKNRRLHISRTNFTGTDLVYSVCPTEYANVGEDVIYVPYIVQSLSIDGAKPHISALTQSNALATVAPPPADYTPTLPALTVPEGILSGPQLETVIYAGQAHSRFLTGWFCRDDLNGQLKLSTAGSGFRLRQGFFLGDGTGCGKGRQIAGVIMDNFVKGRRRAVWVSKSEALLEDAVRDWTALGGSQADIIPQSRTPYGQSIIAGDAILFTTFSTLRGDAHDERDSRLAQLMKWLGDDFDGVMAFDEAHAMQNAMDVETDFGKKIASQQARAGLKLQISLPNARVLYSSATGASAVENLAYADRLGLWRGTDAPFTSQSNFVAEMTKGGVAAMEMICRDLKALGLYCARNLSFEGVEYDFLDHELTEEQIAIYDQYADAFQFMHHSLETILETIGVKEGDYSLNGRAVGAARSSFESTKQRFFNHLLTAMKVPTLIASIESNLSVGDCAVVQIVSTGEAVMNRRLATLSPADLAEGRFDLTPREAVMDYLENSFPTHLFEQYVDDNGNRRARLATFQDGGFVTSEVAVQVRNDLVARLASLPPVTSALDQLVWHFGTDNIAEITGRSRRIVHDISGLTDRVIVERRNKSSKLSETQAFMEDKKKVLIFSEAGGTGRSYHADLGVLNQRRRVHYLLEPGWRADAAIQGLGRTHRTNQACPPLFRPVSTDVKGEKRFLSTIARRLDALGALTKGERATGGQGMFRPEDNLESAQAMEALRVFFKRLANAPQGGISLTGFCELTGLKLVDEDGSLLESLPPIRRFLNRLLALTIPNQNTLFAVFEEIIDNRVELARAAGTLDEGAETIRAEAIIIKKSHDLRRDPITGALTQLLEVEVRRKTNPPSYQDVVLDEATPDGAFYVNARSKAIAYCYMTTSMTDETTGCVEERVELARPTGRERIRLTQFEESAWERTNRETARFLWEGAIAQIPEYEIETFGLVTGLIMPLWSLLNSGMPTVYRLTDQTGTTHLGRYVDMSLLPKLVSHFGGEMDRRATVLESVIPTLKKRERVYITDECFLRMAKVMDRDRIELCDFDNGWMDTLKAFGCFVEIIDYRTRIFIPNCPEQDDIIGNIQGRFGSLSAGSA